MPRKSKKVKIIEEEEAGAVALAGNLNKSDIAPSGGALQTAGTIPVAGAVHIAGNLIGSGPDGGKIVSKEEEAGKLNFNTTIPLGDALKDVAMGALLGAGSKSDDDDIDPSELKNKAARHFFSKIDDMDDDEFYHWVLDLNARQWEAIREAANQLLGGSVSKMWMPISAKDKAAGLKSGMQNYRDILYMSNKGAGARLVELEHDAMGQGFKSALKHSAKSGRKMLLNVAKKFDKGLPKAAKAIGKTVEGIGKAANIVSGIAAPIAAANPESKLGQLASQVNDAALISGDASSRAAPLAEKAKELGNKKSGLKELKKAAKNIEKNPMKLGQDLANISQAVSQPGQKVGNKILSGIDAASKAVANKEQPQQGGGPAAFQDEKMPGGGFRKSAMLDPRKCY